MADFRVENEQVSCPPARAQVFRRGVPTQKAVARATDL